MHDLLLEVVTVRRVVGRQLDLADRPRRLGEIEGGQHHQITARGQPGDPHSTLAVRARQHGDPPGVPRLLGVDHVAGSQLHQRERHQIVAADGPTHGR